MAVDLLTDSQVIKADRRNGTIIITLQESRSVSGDQSDHLPDVRRNQSVATADIYADGVVHIINGCDRTR